MLSLAAFLALRQTVFSVWVTFPEQKWVPSADAFVEGNGRTARAACYYLLCLKQGQLLPGTKIVPERIRENRQPYYGALQAADIAWEQGHFDVSALTRYLSDLLLMQISES